MTNNFSIKFTDERIPEDWIEPGEKASFAEVTIGDFDERILIPLEYWTKQKYLEQWTYEIGRFISGDRNMAVLIVQMHDPLHANFISCWIIYRENSGLFANNNLLFMENIKEPFNIQNLHEYVGTTREEFSDDGTEISTWSTDETAVGGWHKDLWTFRKKK